MQPFVENPGSRESGPMEMAWYDLFSGFEGRLDEPGSCLQKWRFDDIKTFGDAWDDHYISLRNLIHQLNSLREVSELARGFEPDIVIFARPDLCYHTPLPSILFSERRKRRKDSLFVRDNEIFLPFWQWWSGYNDRFAVCGKRAFEIYGNRVEKIMPVLRGKQQALQGESFLKTVLDDAGCIVQPLPVYASRVRITGQNHNEDFSYRQNMDQIGKPTAFPLLIQIKGKLLLFAFRQYLFH